MTYTVVTPANPYLVCAECGAKVDGWRVYPPGAEERPTILVPCGHAAALAECPSWGPVDGCRCDPPGHPDVLPDNVQRS